MEIFGDTIMFGSVRSAPDDLDLDGLEAKTGQDAIAVISEVMEHRREQLKERRLAEARRLSDPHYETTADGTCWEYVIVDASSARVTGVELPADGITRLEIPQMLGSLPVLGIGPGACERLSGVEEIICADCIESIAPSAFRICRDLRRLVLPVNVTDFDSSWINLCDKLDELVLPGMLERIGADIFENGSLSVLELGMGTSQVEPGAFATSKLQRIIVSADNPFLVTDGVGLYAYRNRVGEQASLSLLAIAVSCDSYDIPVACTEVGPKAFACCPELSAVTMGDAVHTIGAHAFARTKIERFTAPSGLASIGKRAFYRCRYLAQAELNEGLIQIGDEAFADTAIASLRVPASMQQLSCSCVKNTQLACSGSKATLFIDPGGALQMDGFGVLYGDLATLHDVLDAGAGMPEGSIPSSGLVLLGMMDAKLTRYAVREGCVAIGPSAFARAPKLTHVTLPDGLVSIGPAAFRSCTQLRHVTFPETLRVMGDEAFLDANLEELYLPASFEHLGKLALAMQGMRELVGPPSLARVQVNPNCKRFYHTGGLFCERTGEGHATVVLFDGSCQSVKIPAEVDTLSPYAFGNAVRLNELCLSTGVRHIGTRALDVNCLIEHIHVDFAHPVEGHAAIDLHFPRTYRSANEIARGFNAMTYLNVELLLARYDSCVINLHDYDASNVEPVDVYEQLTRAVARLEDPLYLSATNRRMYEQTLREGLVEMCVAAARHDDRASIESLVELGFIDRLTIIPVINAVGALQDAAMTGYLLEIQRGFSGGSRVDFDL